MGRRPKQSSYGFLGRQIIHLVPVNSSYHVNCISKDKGKEVKEACKVGCIGCGLCVKQCDVGAIALKDNYAQIDAALCVACGKCSTKCPTNAISNLLDEIEKEYLPLGAKNQLSNRSVSL